ncbi:T-box transcription factor TBX3-like [Gigantopelta aegis]|uniref:T-box transcription factor TBX3-like n=1 Tax=Gigantopelta aegis TaxID=1735272 RepID=UPI001B88BF9F|nr:T-box transcription factor TBX3-like [Gigantopelta aegis]
MIPVLVPTCPGNEICWASPSPSCYPTIPGCTSHELPSSEEEEGADDSPVFLTDKELWQAFYQAGTEMIVNKNGRRLFPIIKVTLQSRMEFVHPSSPANGEIWIKESVSFESIRLTHKEDSKGGNILLHTMHKYNINIIIQPLDSSMEEMVYPLANSTFIAVSSYYSSKITDLTMEHNPFSRRAKCTQWTMADLQGKEQEEEEEE